MLHNLKQDCNAKVNYLAQGSRVNLKIHENAISNHQKKKKKNENKKKKE